MLASVFLFSTGLTLSAQRIAPAQSSRTSTIGALVININVDNFTATIRGKIYSDRRIQLPPGKYSITFKADGYADFVTDVTINGETVLTVNMQAIAAVATPVPAPSVFALIFQCNVPGAQVFIGTSLIGSVANPVALPVGTYQIKISAPGYRDFVNNVTIQSQMTLPVNLVPNTFNLSISANVPNAQITVNNMSIKSGSVVALPPGAVNIRATAPGYTESNQSLNLTEDRALNIVLSPSVYNLQITVNVNGASIFVNNSQLQSQNASAVAVLPAGTYPVRITAPGYQDYNNVVQLTGNMPLTVQLQVAMGTLTLVQPKNTNLMLQIDGTTITADRYAAPILLNPGQHKIRIGIGALSSDVVIVDLQPGQNLSISPKMIIEVR